MTKGAERRNRLDMKAFHLLAIGAVVAALPVLSAEAGAQQRPVFGTRTPPPRPDHWGGKHHGFHIPFLVVEREVVKVVEVEVPAPPAAPAPEKAAPPPEPRKPFVIGQRYASLPGGCMKLIEGGASYYYCGGGEWYRQSGKMYRAVARP